MAPERVMKRRVALVTQDLSQGGGLATMTAFLWNVLSKSDHYCADIVTLSASASDRASARIRSAGSWSGGVRVLREAWRGLPYTHVGAWWTEFEFQRYKPRREVRSLLQQYDLI